MFFLPCFAPSLRFTGLKGEKEGIIPLEHRGMISVWSILVPVHLGWPLLLTWEAGAAPASSTEVTPGEVGDLRLGTCARTHTSTGGSCQGSMLMPTQRLTGALTGADSEYAISSYKRRLRHTALP